MGRTGDAMVMKQVTSSQETVWGRRLFNGLVERLPFALQVASGSTCVKQSRSVHRGGAARAR